MPLFLDNLIENFYEPVGADFRRSYARGQIFWTHIGYSREDLQLWRPTGLDPSQTTVNSFRMEPAGKDAFKRAMPLYIPPLETNEELIVAKAKRRPVILLSPVPAHPGIQELRGGGRIYRRLCVVVPIYSLVDRHTEEIKYRQPFLDKVRLMAYPEFLYLPQAPGVLRHPSYARVSELQAVYQPHLEPENLQLSNDIRSILQGQVIYLISGVYSGAFQIYREQLLHQEDLPE